MSKRDYIVVDIETSSLDWKTGKIHGVAVAYEEDVFEYVKFRALKNHKLKDDLANPNLIKIFHNAGFDVKFLRKNGYPVNGPIYDTLILAQLVDENSSLKLKDLAVRYLGADSIKYANQMYKWLADNNLKKDDIIKAPEDLVKDYACEDVNNTYKLYYLLGSKLKALDVKLKTVFKYKKNTIDYLKEEAIPIEPILWHMETNGVNIDLDTIENTRKEIAKEQDVFLTKLQTIASKEVEEIITLQYEKELEKRVTPKGKERVKRPEFNWQSTKQIGTLLFDKLGLKEYIQAKTEKGQWQCSDEVIKKSLKIKELPDKLHEFLQTYNEYTKTLKKLSTYIGDKENGLLSHVKDGKIYASYKQIGEGSARKEAGGTNSGRLSSANPNLQNLAPFSRKFFIPEKGKVFLYFDYSQIELRLAAHFSKDPIFLESYNEGGDLHKESAAAAFDVPVEEVTKEQRQIGKTINFLLIYNGSANRLKKQLELSPPKGPGLDVTDYQAKEFRDAFFNKYEVYKQYLENLRAFMFKYKFVRSPFGRIRRLPELKYQSGIDVKNREYRGPYVGELKELLKKVKPGTTNFYGEPLTIYDIAKKKVAHALNQGFNFPNQSAAASITKRAMIELTKAGYNIVNQIHDSITMQVDEKNIDKDIVICKNIMESITKLRVPIIAEHKIIKSFDETDVI